MADDIKVPTQKVGGIGGNRKPKRFRECACCGVVFGPIKYLSSQFCSYGCKVKAQTTGRNHRPPAVTKARSAQSLVAYHIKAGHILRPCVCEECGASDRRIEAAHRDYSRPLDVRWLCRPCHVRWDKAEPKGGVTRWENATGQKATRP